MIYHLIFLVLVLGATWECWQDRVPKWLVAGSVALLTAFLCLRYGQGSDYFSYGHIYYELPQNLFSALASKDIHGEWGWKLLCLLGRWLGMPYPAFILAISLAQMGLFWRFLRRFCKKPMLALLLAWHTLYLTYFFGILRQGLAIAIFLGALLEWLEKKKYLPYALGCLACASLHSSALVLLALPLLERISIKWLLILAAAAWAGGLTMATGIFNRLFETLLPASVAYYLTDAGISLVAAAERIVTFGALLGLWYLCGKDQEARNLRLLKISAAGFALYGALLWMPLVASRTGYFLKVVEVCLFGNLMPKTSRKWVIFGFCLVLSAGMYVKNLGSYLQHAAYFDWVTVWNYPYVTVFQKENILRFLTPPYHYLP